MLLIDVSTSKRSFLTDLKNLYQIFKVFNIIKTQLKPRKWNIHCVLSFLSLSIKAIAIEFYLLAERKELL